MTNETPSSSNLSRMRLRALRMTVAAAALAALAFGAGGFMPGSSPDTGSRVPRQTSGLNQYPSEYLRPAAAVTQRGTPATPPRMLEQGMPFSFADLVEHVSPAVVTVVVERESTRQQGATDDIPAPFRDFFRQFGNQGQGQGQGQGGQGQGRNRAPQTFRSQAMGSGFIIDPTGYIVTNNHVVEDGKKISVKMPNGREFTANLVGADKDTDVALLKIDGVKDLPIVAFGDDRRLRVGDWVVAVGNPFGLGGTVTAGIVSSIGRDIGNGPYTDYIQIDAPINQGNSGGPTFDLSGRVVGVNSAIFSPSGGSVGIGFAIPASTVKAIVDQLKDHGNVARGWLGVQIQSLTPDMAASLGANSEKGAIVANVIDDSPAAKAGFKQGDVILSLNGSEVDDQRDLTRKVAGLLAGERANFAILRDGMRRNITALIAKRDEAQLASATPTPNQGNNNRGGNRDSVPTMTTLGMEMMTLTTETRDQYDIDASISGVVVTAVDPNSEAADKGFRPGDVIVSVGNKNVRTPADIEQGVAEAKRANRESVLFLVAGRGGQRYVALKVAKA
jgi:serine protease Do